MVRLFVTLSPVNYSTDRHEIFYTYYLKDTIVLKIAQDRLIIRVYFQGFGYLTCVMATANYVLALYEIVTMNDCFVIFWLQAIFDIFFYIKTYFSMHQVCVKPNVIFLSLSYYVESDQHIKVFSTPVHNFLYNII